MIFIYVYYLNIHIKTVFVYTLRGARTFFIYPPLWANQKIRHLNPTATLLHTHGMFFMG